MNQRFENQPIPREAPQVSVNDTQMKAPPTSAINRNAVRTVLNPVGGPSNPMATTTSNASTLVIQVAGVATNRGRVGASAVDTPAVRAHSALDTSSPANAIKRTRKAWFVLAEVGQSSPPRGKRISRVRP